MPTNKGITKYQWVLIIAGLAALGFSGFGLYSFLRGPGMGSLTWVHAVLIVCYSSGIAAGLALLFASAVARGRIEGVKPRGLQRLVLAAGVVYLLGLVTGRGLWLWIALQGSHGDPVQIGYLAGFAVGTLIGLAIPIGLVWYLYTAADDQATETKRNGPCQGAGEA